MSEELKNTDIGETSSGKASKNTLKKVLKVLAWIAGVWFAILVILQVALSPSVLTKVVNRFAAEYLDVELTILVSESSYSERSGLRCSVTSPT